MKRILKSRGGEHSSIYLGAEARKIPHPTAQINRPKRKKYMFKTNIKIIPAIVTSELAMMHRNLPLLTKGDPISRPIIIPITGVLPMNAS